MMLLFFHFFLPRAVLVAQIDIVLCICAGKHHQGTSLVWTVASTVELCQLYLPIALLRNVQHLILLVWMDTTHSVLVLCSQRNYQMLRKALNHRTQPYANPHGSQ
jgi:hypothetical protein